MRDGMAPAHTQLWHLRVLCHNGVACSKWMSAASAHLLLLLLGKYLISIISKTNGMLLMEVVCGVCAGIDATYHGYGVRNL